MKAIYISDDGIKFDEKYECERHELELALKNSKAIGLSYNLNEIPLEKWMDFELYSIYIPKDNDKGVLKYVNWYDNCDIPTKKGLYIYDEVDDIWKNLDDEINTTSDYLKHCLNIKDLLLKKE